jgi:D-serine dehydratase
VDDIAFDGTTKGLPERPINLSEIGGKGWRLTNGDVPLPAASLKTSALEANSRWMKAFLAATGAQLAPHGKTTMSPELFARQLADGAWGMTVADARQMRVAVRAGARRVVIANEQAGPGDFASVTAALAGDPELDVFVLADSVEGVARCAAAVQARPPRQRLNVLVEMGYAGGRGGCRDRASALAVARAAAAARGLAGAGVEAFEGLNMGMPRIDATSRIGRLLDAVATAAEAFDAEGLFGREEAVLSAGGSAFFDVAAERLAKVRLSRPHVVLIRSGCYVSHDVGMYERAFVELLDRSPRARDIPGRLENALEVWAYVLSVPEPGRAILGAGRRDIGCDSGPPTPLRWCRPGRDAALRPPGREWKIAAVNDQHAHLTFPANEPLAYGDMVALGASHPCATFDRWRVIHLIDDDCRITGAVRTCF